MSPSPTEELVLKTQSTPLDVRQRRAGLKSVYAGGGRSYDASIRHGEKLVGAFIKTDSLPELKADTGRKKNITGDRRLLEAFLETRPSRGTRITIDRRGAVAGSPPDTRRLESRPMTGGDPSSALIMRPVDVDSSEPYRVGLTPDGDTKEQPSWDPSSH
ncbi:hypothetical protein EYF80_039760 [Liparis tanakae]|uniref:Uncharacterized protein n=1 Tax=Liparis tanakae TaxID=230148 RepID=A0A4Z2G903_9TELE|nr:hypothetical protein EYF80_039760 [Liparis tanakae]